VAQIARSLDNRIFSQLFDSSEQAAFAYSVTAFKVLDANDAAVGRF